MDIVYLGHSSFQLKGKKGTVVIDPYNAFVGFSMPAVTADVVTISHQHPDHNELSAVKPTTRRDKPFVISQPGEYEVSGISVFGVETWHDAVQGAQRGPNTIYTIMLDELRVCHLGDLGHELSPEMVEAIGSVDVVLCPVGGHFTISAVLAVKTILQLEPAYVIPMHFKTDRHDENVFADLQPLSVFLHEYGMSPPAIPKLNLEKTTLPEETELIVLSA